MVGELRFQKPLPTSNWEGVYNATKYRNACIQPDKVEPDNNIPEETTHGEDCLFLSVWQPPTPLPNGKKRSVMYWIHGGGFEAGTIFSLAYDARYIAIFGDVVVVTVNYRLGPFGFLYGGTDDSPGNAGLYDQILGLKWVRDNIEQFGGDPESVTIFGESAGLLFIYLFLIKKIDFHIFEI
jgi:carboxylesterase type B